MSEVKEALSSVDIAVIVEELQDLLGAKVEKVYQREREIILRLHAHLEGKRLEAYGSSVDLVLEAGRRIHLTKYRMEMPKTPTSFAMLLRKHLKGGRIRSIKQRDFDRIVEICVERADGRRTLVLELLPRGNLLLLDENGRILQPLKRETFTTRTLLPGKLYETPPSKLNPLVATQEDLRNLFIAAKEEVEHRGKRGKSREVVKVLATETGLGGLYAEEVCLRAGVNKKKSAEMLSDEEIRAIYDAIREIFEPIIERDMSKIKPHIVFEANKEGKEAEESEERQGCVAVQVLPFELRRFEGCEKEYFQTFNDAVDEFFMRQTEERSQFSFESEIEKIERILREQESALLKFKQEEEECIRKAELIYTRFKEIEDALREHAEELRKKGVKKREISLTLNDEGDVLELKLDPTRSLHENAARYYERAKALRKKREGVEKALAATRAKLEAERERVAAAEAEAKAEKAKARVLRKKVVRDKKWYERFRWFFTSSGFLVVGGRDATSNEILVKKHMANEDIFFHTQAEGAPAVILKTEGRPVSDADLEEAAQFAASYSSLWKLGFYSGECYCVSATQVSKTPPSGEYLRKGGFVVRGKRRYFKVELALCVGIAEEKENGRKCEEESEGGESGKREQEERGEREEREEREREGEGESEKKRRLRLVVCPVLALKHGVKLKYWVEVQPGDTRKEEIARAIRAVLLEQAEKHGEREELEEELSLDKLLQVLPPGRAAIKSA
ncbi:MAG: ribosome rescue protein RqcH [Candidatus Methanospirare jalkutatii]|nr:ribosome rescue protein RqcH [Candidatus Methanospirare jalkutatii]